MTGDAMRSRTILTIALTVLAVGIVAVAYSQTDAAKPVPKADGKTLVAEDNTFFSWGIVLMLLGGTASAVTAMVQSRAHINNDQVHVSGKELAETYMRKSDCQARHADVKDEFSKLHDKLTEIAGGVEFIRGKMEGK